MEYEGDYIIKKYNGKGYGEDGNIIYELKNGTGIIKEYDNYNSKFEFEGEYLNGLRNGKGKEYGYDGKLSFEGEYLFNKRYNGKGYYKNGKII